MCGPLMLAIPLPRETRQKMALQTAVYQAGRILMYATLGLLFGLLGKGIALAGMQQALSLLAGGLLIMAAFFSLLWEKAVLSIPGLRHATHWVQQTMGRMLRRHANRSSFALGMLNGLLPCGLVYAAVAGALATTEGWQGAVFMLLFGLGTLPLLFGLMLSGHKISASIRARFKIIQPILIATAGLLLISRRLHLALSLFYSSVPKASYDCH